MFFTFKKKLKTIFLTGMLITLPIALTLFILKFLFRNLDSLSPTFTQLLIRMGVPIPEGYRIPFIGVFMTLFIIFLIGVFVNNIFGKQLVLLGETIVQKIPFFRRIYSGSKQIVASFTSVDTKSFNQVVLIEFPRRGVYALGFVTSASKGEIQQKTAENVLNVFVPTTPNPTSGFLIFSPAEELLELTMTIEEGVKYVISGGIVDPIATKEFLKKQDAN
jgi:uncharacterized membrane protein